MVLNDISPSGASRTENCGNVGVPDLTFVDAAIANRFSWEASNEVGFDHLPILIWGDLNAIWSVTTEPAIGTTQRLTGRSSPSVSIRVSAASRARRPPMANSLPCLTFLEMRNQWRYQSMPSVQWRSYI